MQKLGGVQILMKSVNYIIGDKNILNIPMQPCCEDVCNFLNEVSTRLMKSQKFENLQIYLHSLFGVEKQIFKNCKNIVRKKID